MKPKPQALQKNYTLQILPEQVSSLNINLIISTQAYITPQPCVVLKEKLDLSERATSIDIFHHRVSNLGGCNHNHCPEPNDFATTWVRDPVVAYVNRSSLVW